MLEVMLQHVSALNGNIDVLDHGGFTPLHRAIQMAQVDAARKLLAYGADPRRLTEDGSTTLGLAAGVADDDDAIGMLIEAGVEVNEMDRLGRTALHVAAAYGSLAALKQLLAHGADPNAVGFGRSTPLHVASRKGDLNCVKTLLEAGANRSARNNVGLLPIDVASTEEVRAVLQ
jgi:ankyrin repeat protein